MVRTRPLRAAPPTVANLNRGTPMLVTLRNHDERVLHFLVQRRHRHVDSLMRAVTRAGDPPVAIGVTLLLLLGVVPGVATAGMIAALTLTGSHVLVQTLKRSVSRPRPYLPVGIERLMEPPDRFSFPSGHAAASLSIALALSTVLPPLAAAPVLALAVLVGVSRCYLGVHYPGDVAMGWLLAWITFRAGLFLL